MRTFDDGDGDDIAARFTAQLAAALPAQALAETGSLPGECAKALLRDWLIGTFSATAAGLATIGEGRGELLGARRRRTPADLVHAGRNRLSVGAAPPAAERYVGCTRCRWRQGRADPGHGRGGVGATSMARAVVVNFAFVVQACLGNERRR